MPITTAEAPEEVTAAAVRGFTALRRSRVTTTDEFGGGTEVQLHAPIAVYHGFGVLSGLLTYDHNPVGWRYLVGGGTAVRSIEMVGKDVVAVAQGAAATNLVKALEFAVEQVDDTTDHYEARLLEFGRAVDSLLWLHSESDDRFFAIMGEPREVGIGETFKRFTAKTALRRAAQRSEVNAEIDSDESGG